MHVLIKDLTTDGQLTLRTDRVYFLGMKDGKQVRLPFNVSTYATKRDAELGIIVKGKIHKISILEMDGEF